MLRVRRSLLIFCVFLVFTGCTNTRLVASTPDILTGAEQSERYLPLLKDKRVGLVVNQTSLSHNQHLLDFLLAQKVDVVRVFSPEHGFRGDHDAGAYVNDEVDGKTGIAITSIYGKNKKPPKNLMAELDVIIFDIQDVGVRFYTYISSLHYMMEAAAENNVAFIVLDRPNPNGRFVDGPILEPEFRSFVGMHTIPVLHGMTVAELALMIKGENWINQAGNLQLTTISNAHYNRGLHYSLPVAPSPNLPNSQSIQLYPSLCFFEATPVSVGRGTAFPFQVIGHNTLALGDFSFSPKSMPGSALHPKLEGKSVLGVDLRDSDLQGLDLSLLIAAHKRFEAAGVVFFERPEFMDKLAGTNKLRMAIEKGLNEQQIKELWQSDLFDFRQLRRPYLLYADGL